MIKRSLKKIITYILSQYMILNRSVSPFTKWEIENKSESYEYFKKYYGNSVLFTSVEKIRDFVINKILEKNKYKLNENDLFLEFGVFKGESLNFFSNKLKLYSSKIYGFDSFDGLSHDWLGNINHSAKTFKTSQIPPHDKEKIELVVGNVFETLDKFIEERIKRQNLKIVFIHMDLDIYEPSSFVLKKIKPFLKSGAIILFDQLYNYPGWKEGEYKALKENFNDNEYEYIAFTDINQVAIRICK